MRFYELVEAFDKFLFGGLSETASSEMLYYSIHIRHVMRTSPHFKSVPVYFGNRYRHIVCAVEISDYPLGKPFVGVKI